MFGVFFNFYYFFFYSFCSYQYSFLVHFLCQAGKIAFLWYYFNKQGWETGLFCVNHCVCKASRGLRTKFNSLYNQSQHHGSRNRSLLRRHFFLIALAALSYTFFSPGLYRTTSIWASLGMSEQLAAESMEKAALVLVSLWGHRHYLMELPHKFFCIITYIYICVCICKHIYIKSKLHHCCCLQLRGMVYIIFCL